MPPLLEMIGVKKRFGATIALDGVDLAIEPGQVRALVGENGAGKSTLMKVLSGAHLPDEGEMRLAGQPYHPRNPLDARKAGVAMIYQELSLCPHMSVAENILLGVEPGVLGLMNWRESRRRSRSALGELEHAEIDPRQKVSQLSVGARQLVEIARAIAMDCRVLVFDEPTSSLTQQDAEKLFTLIDRLKGRGIGVIYISHFMEEIRRVADVFTVLRDGKTVGGGITAQTLNEAIIQMMVGRTVDDLYPRSERNPGEVVLEIHDLAGKSKPVDASLQLRRGEVLGIAGLMGAGRTEFLRTIFGLDAVRSGTVRLEAIVGNYSPARRWDQGMGLVSEDRKGEGLALNMSIADNMTLSQMKGLGIGPTIFPSRQQRAANIWVEKLRIRCREARQPVGSLSGGNQQKVAIARLLHHHVDVLLLDEPTRGIDVGSKASIYQLIDELACDGKAVLVVSSYLPELMGICDRIAVMCKGKLGPARPVKEVDAHRIMQEATNITEN
ncbi:MAG TPA: sugar ABC transporter ATP-binding protein [Tepidisphaeraceae bacterium]|jgi:ribose transport system ATP-binding protein